MKKNLILSLRATLSAAALACALALSPALTAADAPATPLRPLVNGDKVVFLGDSITAGAVRPNGYITMLSAQAEKNGMKVECIGAGRSGNTVSNLQQRLDKDVLALHPAVVVVFIGVNDVWHQERGRGTSREDYATGLKDLITRIRAAKAEPILCTPCVIGEKVHWEAGDMQPPPPSDDPKKPAKKYGIGQLAVMLDEYCEISRNTAKELKVPLVDLHAAFLKFIANNNPNNKVAGILTGDTVHPNSAGNNMIAEQIGAALGIKFQP